MRELFGDFGLGRERRQAWVEHEVRRAGDMANRDFIRQHFLLHLRRQLVPLGQAGFDERAFRHLQSGQTLHTIRRCQFNKLPHVNLDLQRAQPLFALLRRQTLILIELEHDDLAFRGRKCRQEFFAVRRRHRENLAKCVNRAGRRQGRRGRSGNHHGRVRLHQSRILRSCDTAEDQAQG